MKQQLDQIRARLNAASPGPWEVNGDHFYVCSVGNSNIDGKDYDVCMNGYAARDGANSDAKTDADFIAHAPTDIARLLKAIERLREQRDANYDGPLPDQAAERADQEIKRILEGD